METASKDAAQVFQTHKEDEVSKVRAQPRKSKSKIFQKTNQMGHKINVGGDWAPIARVAFPSSMKMFQMWKDWPRPEGM